MKMHLENGNVLQPARSLSDYQVTTAEFLPRGQGKNATWPALGWSMWERAEDFLAQLEEHQGAPDAAPPPELRLLATDTADWGSVERVTVEVDPRDGREVLCLHVRDHKAGGLPQRRIFDPAPGLLLLMLGLPGGNLGFNSGGAKATYLYYQVSGDKVPVRRLLANAKVNYRELDAQEDLSHPFGFRSYLLRDWAKTQAISADDFTIKPSYTDRQTAFDLALTCFDKRAVHLQGRIDAYEYLKRLLRCARQVDRLWALHGAGFVP